MTVTGNQFMNDMTNIYKGWKNYRLCRTNDYHNNSTMVEYGKENWRTHENMSQYNFVQEGRAASFGC
jgi:hypothetical protein